MSQKSSSFVAQCQTFYSIHIQTHIQFNLSGDKQASCEHRFHVLFLLFFHLFRMVFAPHLFSLVIFLFGFYIVSTAEIYCVISWFVSFGIGDFCFSHFVLFSVFTLFCRTEWHLNVCVCVLCGLFKSIYGKVFLADIYA